MDDFQKVINPSEIRSVLLSLAKSKYEIQAKLTTSDTSLFTLKSYKFESDLLYTQIAKTPEEIHFKGEFIVSFLVGDIKYYGLAKYRFLDGDVILQFNEGLFQLQRRQDFRLRFPDRMPAYYLIKSKNNHSENSKTLIFDMSAGGLRVAYPILGMNLSSGDHLIGELYIQNRLSIDIESEVKHITMHATDKQSQSAGLQFINLSLKSKNKLAALVLDMYREYFTVNKK
jgi:hypothetical protein